MEWKTKYKDAAELLELRSQEIQEILGQVPAWIIRYGTVIVAIVFVVFFIVSAYLKYPDVIYADITLTTEVPPAEITSNKSGRIADLLVEDKEIADSGQVLAIIQSSASYKDILTIKALLSPPLQIDSLKDIVSNKGYNLGENQTAFANFQTSLQDYFSYKKLDYYNRKINAVKEEQKKYSNLLYRLKGQEKALQREYKLSYKQFERDSLLHEDGVLSTVLFEGSEAKALKSLYNWKDIQARIVTNQIKVSGLKQELLELELKKEESAQAYKLKVEDAYEKLKGAISIWEEENLIWAPFKGQVSFTKFWSENQSVEKGEIVMTVIPVEKGKIIGKIRIGAHGAGKITEGDKVIIRFDNYPFMEFGTMSGTVHSISLVPNDNIYSAEVHLANQELRTNYDIPLRFKQNMSGSTEIITEKRSLLERIFAPIKSALKNQQSM